MICYLGLFYGKTYFFVKICFCPIIRGNLQTHTDTWTNGKTFLHIGLSDLENRFQWLVFNCRQTDNTTHWKDNHFSQALVWYLSWVEQYSTNVCRENHIKLFCFQMLSVVAELRAAFNSRRTIWFIHFFITDSNTR